MNPEIARAFVNRHLASLVGVSPDQLSDHLWSMNTGDADYDMKFALLKLNSMIDRAESGRVPQHLVDALMADLDAIQGKETERGSAATLAALVDAVARARAEQ